jgi:hypothetical protein
MSLTAFKKKSVINYGSKRSGKPPGGVWLPRGPFGSATSNLKNIYQTYGDAGFSINGGHRNVGYIGKTYKMSKSGTPYRGVHAIGWGGTYGKYTTVEPLLNSREVDTLGTQYIYIKPSVLSTKGMLETRFKWINNGQYPNNWVQPVYTGNQTDTASQGLYIQNLASANTCNLKVNNTQDYVGNIKNHGPTLCSNSTAKFKYNDMVRNAPYTKILNQPVTYGQYNLFLTKKCNNPQGFQKPFPFAVQTGSGILTGGVSVTNVGNACNTSSTYLTPPDWYTNTTTIPTPTIER